MARTPDDHGVSDAYLFQASVGDYREAPGGVHLRVEGAHGRLVRGLPRGEDLRWDRQIKGHDLVQGQNRDPMNAHGKILSKSGNFAYHQVKALPAS
ncbi:hypothetical protein ACFV47_25135 [Streptomyces solisilvae]|uniref:hypothetical protein n=1 Tax=Streptomyces malaysiensis TaxID=92644 RepID=UPI0036CBEE96